MASERPLREQIELFMAHHRTILLERFDRLTVEQQEGLRLALIVYAPPPEGGGPLEEAWMHLRTIEDRLELAEFYRKAAEQIATIEMNASWRTQAPRNLAD